MGARRPRTNRPARVQYSAMQARNQTTRHQLRVTPTHTSCSGTPRPAWRVRWRTKRAAHATEARQRRVQDHHATKAAVPAVQDHQELELEGGVSKVRVGEKSDDKTPRRRPAQTERRRPRRSSSSYLCLYDIRKELATRISRDRSKYLIGKERMFSESILARLPHWFFALPSLVAPRTSDVSRMP